MVAVLNRKGGAGKTSLTKDLGFALSELGVGARAARYRAELARGHWQLPPHWTTTPTPPPSPKEASPHDPSHDHTPARRAAP